MRKPWQEMDGLTTPEACEHLAALGMQVPADQAIVEVGVYLGRSLAALATYAVAPVYGVDPWNLPRPSKPKYSDAATYAEALNNLADYGNVTLVRDFGTRLATRWGPEYPKVGLLYIDADHRKLPVLEDFAAWRPHMAPGCTVAFDDHHVSFPGVVEAVQCLWQKHMITRPVMLTDRLAVSTLL